MPAFFQSLQSGFPALRLARLAAGASLAALLLAAAQAQAFGLDDVAALARQHSLTPWREASHAVPAELARTAYDNYRDIRFNAANTLWRADKRLYEASFFRVGRHGDSVRIHEITTTTP